MSIDEGMNLTNQKNLISFINQIVQRVIIIFRSRFAFMDHEFYQLPFSSFLHRNILVTIEGMARNGFFNVDSERLFCIKQYLLLIHCKKIKT